MQTISMKARNLKSKDPRTDKRNTFKAEGSGEDMLKVIGIFGGNASGKSNLLMALYAMIYCTLRSMLKQDILSKILMPFSLDKDSISKPTFFEIKFIQNGNRFRYGFEATKEYIYSEWLFMTKENSKETYLFKKEGERILINSKSFPSGHKLKSSVLAIFPKHNALLLTFFGLMGDDPIIKPIIKYLNNLIRFDFGKTPFSVSTHEIEESILNKEAKSRILKILQTADMNIADLGSQEYASPEGDVELNLVVVKNKRDSNGKISGTTTFNFVLEAEGTKRLFTLGILVDKVLRSGGILLVDEFDARLHPNLSRLIVELFQLPETNPKNAQLIFVSHDTQFMSLDLLRRDQICFVRQNAQRATEIYSLAEFKGVRNDKGVEAEYLRGLYGGVSSLNMFLEAFNQTDHAIEAD